VTASVDRWWRIEERGDLLCGAQVEAVGDIPPRPEPLPKFLNDTDAAKFMAATRAHRLPRYRIVAEILARTGLRASELCDLAADAVTHIGDSHWLRVPVGKLRNDRFIPLHPDLVTLLAEWTATNADHIRTQRRLIADHHAPIDRRTVHRIVSTSEPPPASVMFTPTSCVTPLRPRRSTEACDSKQSPRSSVTVRSR
jgi:integrase